MIFAQVQIPPEVVEGTRHYAATQEHLSWFIVLGWGAAIAIVVFIVGAWAWKKIKKHRMKDQVESGNGATTIMYPVCPICEKPNKGDSFPMPRLAERQKEFTFGKYKLLWAREIKEGDVKACAMCAEEAWSDARLKMQGVYVNRARDAERELQDLVNWQREKLTPIRQREKKA